MNVRDQILRWFQSQCDDNNESKVGFLGFFVWFCYLVVWGGLGFFLSFLKLNLEMKSHQERGSQ